ncbi:MAG: TonB-dependent receptor [Bryobacteraceae bacterium]|nr:TonB-dependent receptor [Bryobacteraceae bacterium]
MVFWLYFLIMSAVVSAQDTTGVGVLNGSVVEEGTRQPVAGVKVCLATTGRCAESDARGRFRIGEVRPGSYTLEVSRPGGGSLTKEGIEIRAGLEGEVEVLLPDIGATSQQVTVSAEVFVAPEEVKNSGFLLQPIEISKSAGALQDVSRYVATLPGAVIGSNDFRNDIIVRGGSPLENLFVVDNVEIPNINNYANFASAGGPVTMLDSELIQDVTFLTGGYPSPYINRLSSVLQVALREGSREKFRKRAIVNFAGAGGILEGPVKDKGSWLFSVRRSYLDWFTDDVGFGGVPRNTNFNTKVLYDLDARNRLWMVNITGVDDISIRPDGVSKNQVDNVFNIDYDGWRSATGLNWQRLMGERAVGLLGVTHSESKVGARVGEQLFGDREIFFDNSREGESTIKYDLTAILPVLDKVQTGASVKIFRLDYNTAQPIGVESPFSVERGRINALGLRRSFVANQTGAYFQTSRAVSSRLNVTYGGRLDHYQYIGRTVFSPRAGLSFRIAPKLSFRASYGHYYQQPFFLFLSAFPVNRGLAPIRSTHYVAGFSYLASSTLRFTVEGYHKTYRNYPASIEFPEVSLANIGDTFNVSELLFPLTAAGRGRVRGLEFFVEKKFSQKFFGQANFSISRTRHAALDGVFRPGNFDYPRVFNMVGGYRLTRNWEVSLRYAYLTGRPYTPFNLAESTRQNRPIFDLARVNAERLPDYQRMDFRLDRTFQTRWGPVLLFVGLQNALGRKNVQGIQWNRRGNEALTEEQLGRFPLIGLDWRF